MDTLWTTFNYVIPPVSCAIVLAAVLGTLARIVRWQRYRIRVNHRLYRYVRRRKARKWTCRKCGYNGTGPAPMGPICMQCWQALDEYLQEVA